MPRTPPQNKRSIGWMSLRPGHTARPLEWLAEKGIFVVSLSAIVLIFLIFLFIAREALPVFLGNTNNSLVQKTIPVEEMDRLTPKQLRGYLGLTEKEFAAMNRETLKSLMEVRIEAAHEAPNDKDAALNTTSWRYLLFPYQWAGYNKQEYIWQPVSQIQKFNIVPLLIGSLKITL